jgi:hypothetical protein
MSLRSLTTLAALVVGAACAGAQSASPTVASPAAATPAMPPAPTTDLVVAGRKLATWILANQLECHGQSWSQRERRHHADGAHTSRRGDRDQRRQRAEGHRRKGGAPERPLPVLANRRVREGTQRGTSAYRADSGRKVRRFWDWAGEQRAAGRSVSRNEERGPRKSIEVVELNQTSSVLVPRSSIQCGDRLSR